ncbi:MAG: flagellar FliL protein [Gammaproteobacteria bacterium]|jgi:flagellar FliL protein
MADKELEIEEGSKKKSKLMLIIAVAVVVLLGGGVGAYFFLFTGDTTSMTEGEDGTSEEVIENLESKAGRALYVAMPRPFTFNAPGVSRERIVQIEVQLMVRGADNEELAKRHIPMIEGTLLLVFSASNADDLVTDVGKVELKERATAEVRQVMTELESSPVVEQVLFTGFVIQ